MRFLDKVAMITGGAGEIGREIALNFSREGALVAVSDLSFMAAESVTDKIKEMKRKALPFKADVTNLQEMESVVDEVVSSFGKIDILVHCAGIRRDAPFHSMTDKAWDEVMGKWLPESGYQPDDRPCYELYHNDPKTHPEGKFLVDICVPVKPL